MAGRNICCVIVNCLGDMTLPCGTPLGNWRSGDVAVFEDHRLSLIAPCPSDAVFPPSLSQHLAPLGAD